MDAPAPAPTRHNGDRSDPARRAAVRPRHKRHEGEDDTQRDAQRAKNPVKNRPEFFARRRRLALSRACPTPPPAAYAHNERQHTCARAAARPIIVTLFPRPRVTRALALINRQSSSPPSITPSRQSCIHVRPLWFRTAGCAPGSGHHPVIESGLADVGPV